MSVAVTPTRSCVCGMPAGIKSRVYASVWCLRRIFLHVLGYFRQDSPWQTRKAVFNATVQKTTGDCSAAETFPPSGGMSSSQTFYFTWNKLSCLFNTFRAYGSEGAMFFSFSLPPILKPALASQCIYFLLVPCHTLTPLPDLLSANTMWRLDAGRIAHWAFRRPACYCSCCCCSARVLHKQAEK